MTIDEEKGRAVAKALDAKLADLSSLEDRIALIADSIEGRVTFSTSLGLEDQAVLHGVVNADSDVDVFMLDTGRHFPETLETLQESELHFGKRIRVVVPERADVEELVARDGVFGFRTSVDARIACCDVRKVRPLKRALKGASVWITGMRRTQSEGRAETPFASWDDEHGLIKVSPIADWSAEQLETFIAENKVPVNPLHARGFPSIGCLPCTRAIEPGEDARAGRWWWENEEGKECGLHNRPTLKANRKSNDDDRDIDTEQTGALA